MSRVAIVANHKSGTASLEICEQLAEAYRAEGHIAHVMKESIDLDTTSHRAVEEGNDVIIAAGGDGTVRCVAGKILGKDIALGVLPLGSLNHFAKDIGLPVGDMDAVIATLVAGHTAHLDSADVNGQIFINTASIGLFPEVVTQREALRGRLGKRLAFALAGFRVARGFREYRLNVEAAGETMAIRTPIAFVGNNDYQVEKFGFADRQSLDRGHLCAYFVKQSSIFGIIRTFLRMVTGRLGAASDFVSIFPAELIINSRWKKLQVALDGELVELATPLKFKSQPQSLNVIIPLKQNTP